MQNPLCVNGQPALQKNPSPELRTIQLYPQYIDITWNRLNLNTSGKHVWVCALQLKWTTSERKNIKLQYILTTLTYRFFFLIVTAVSVGFKFQIAMYYSILACQLQLYCVWLFQKAF